MTTVFDVVVALHVLFMAAVVGGYAVAATQGGRINQVMVWGARLQLVTGAILMAIAKSASHDFNQAVLGIKFVVALGVVACAEIANAKQKRGEDATMLVHISGALALVDFVIGVCIRE